MDVRTLCEGWWVTNGGFGVCSGCQAGAIEMAAHNIEVSTVQGQRISALVGGGLFTSEQDVLNEALALVEAKQARHVAKIKALMDAAQVGIDDIEAGRFEVFNTPEELQARILEIWDEAIADLKAA
jgi:antitoxin ParD1/3/4